MGCIVHSGMILLYVKKKKVHYYGLEESIILYVSNYTYIFYIEFSNACVINFFSGTVALIGNTILGLFMAYCRGKLRKKGWAAKEGRQLKKPFSVS